MAETVLRIPTNVKTIPVYMEHATIQRVVFFVLVKKGGKRKKMKTSVLRTSMNVKYLGILVYMELALIQRVVLIVLAMKGG